MAQLLLAKPAVQDGLIAVGLAGVSLAGVWAHLNVDLPEGGGDVGLQGLDLLGIVLVLLQTIPLAWRRRAPIPVLCVIMSALFLSSALGYFPSLAAFGLLVALYTVAAHRDRRISIPAGIATWLVILAIFLLGREPVELDEVIAELLVVGAVWFLGDGVRIRRGQVVRLEDRATRLERERAEWTHRAVAEERRVIARELHDVVAHNVSVMVAQAGAAQRVFGTHPEDARSALGTIEHTGREALVEMRRLTGFLRTDTDRRAMRSPQPGLDNLDALIRQVGETGVPTTLRIEGEPRPLPPGLDLSAFRIVQEALTNTLKHAGSAHANVVVRYGDSRLELWITDDGKGPGRDPSAAPRPGYGQLGMRERVALFGGELWTGPRSGGGYQVVASLPLNGEPP